jgi:hypothetical protein
LQSRTAWFDRKRKHWKKKTNRKRNKQKQKQRKKRKKKKKKQEKKLEQLDRTVCPVLWKQTSLIDLKKKKKTML